MLQEHKSSRICNTLLNEYMYLNKGIYINIYKHVFRCLGSDVIVRAVDIDEIVDHLQM